MKDTNKHKIVAVNDTPDQLELLEIILGDAGYLVVTAENGAEGLETARRELPDLIVSDVMMPVMNGIELCREVRSDENLSSIPILLVSALRRDAENVAEGLEAGADDYIEAPYDALALAARVARLIERKRMEDVLRESENRFRSLIESVSDIISIISGDGTVIYESPSIENILGYKPEELIGRSAFELLHPEDAPEVIEYFKKCLQSDEPTTPKIYRFRHKNKTWLTLESIGKSFIDPVKGKVAIINSRDITERKKALEAKLESENRLRIIFDNAAIGISLADSKGYSIQSNKALERMLGYTGEELKKMSFVEFTHPDDVDKDVSLAQEIFDGKRRYYQIEKRYIRKNGELIWGNLTVSAISRREDDSIEYIIGMVEDITARKRANAALRESEERFKAQYKGIPIPTVTWKKTGNDFVMVDYNVAADEITKGNIGDFVGIKAGDMYDHSPQIVRDFHQCFNEKSIIRRETPFRFKTTGEEKFLDISCVFVSPDMIMTHYRDITAQIQAEELLKKSEERFQLATRATNDALWDWDLVTNAVWYSNACYKLLGYEPSEDESSIDLWIDAIHPDDKDRVMQNSHSVIENKENYWMDEYRLNSTDGTFSYIFDRGYILYDESGNPVRMIGAAVNVTERKLAEQILQANQERLQKQNNVLNELTKHHKLFHDSLPAAIREITEIAAQTLETERVSVWLYEDGKSKIRAIDLYESNLKRHSEGFELSETDYPSYFKTLALDEGIAAHDALNDARTIEFSEAYLKPLGITSMLDVPIRVGGKVIGVVCHEHIGAAREWKLDEQNFAGSMAALISLLLEANERRQAENALLESKEHLALAQQVARIGSFELNLHTGNATISTELELLYGISGYDPNFGEWLKLIHPEDAQKVEENMQQSLASGEFNTEFRITRGDGSPRWIQGTGKVFYNDEGTPTRMVGVNMDITERKESEKALAEANERAIREYDRLLLRLSTLAVTVGAARDLKTVINAILEFSIASVPCSALFISLYDEAKSVRDGIYLWYNGREIDLSDFSNVPVGTGPVGQAIKSGEVLIINDYLEYLGKKPTNIYYGYDEDQSDPRATIVAPMKIMGKIVGVIEVQSYELNAYTEEHATAMRLASNLAANAIENLRLIEQERTHSEQLRLAQKLESVGRLAGGIAHDFNNMLTAINGYSDLTLRRLTDEDPLRRNIEEIKKAGERSAALTNQLLAFSRRQMLKPKVIDINQTVDEVGMMLKRLIGEDVNLATNLAENLGRVEADPGQLTQVIMNLAVNARDAMPNGGQLTIETANVFLDREYAARHAGTQPGSYVMLAVSDNGTGMSDETLQNIFEPFYTTKATGKGTGLGLATVYGIVKQSGGYIWVYTEIDEGTTFKVYLPRVDEQASAAEEISGEHAILLGKETILLVEDEDIVRNLSRQILETCGYKVVEASNGEEALAIFRQSDAKFDLIVTDVVMPKLSGRQLAEELQKISPETKILFMSGYTDDTIVRQGIIETGGDFIQKPFTFNTLAGKVREMLDHDAKP
jgi:PAS domain S-box-containing protein